LKEITPLELKAKIDNNEDFQLIDVRELYEREISDIGGELIPMGEIMDNVSKISKDKPVIFYCHHGAMSQIVIHALEARFDFSNLCQLKGGIIAWADDIDPSLPLY